MLLDLGVKDKDNAAMRTQGYKGVMVWGGTQGTGRDNKQLEEEASE